MAPEAKRQPTGPGQGLVLAGTRSAVWWFLCLVLDQLTPVALRAFGKVLSRQLARGALFRSADATPRGDPRVALNLLVGEPSARGLVCDVLTDPWLPAEDVDAFTELLHGCRILRQAAADGATRCGRSKHERARRCARRARL